MVDISRVPPDAKPIMLMVGVPPEMVGVAQESMLLLLSCYVTCGGRGHGHVLSLFTKDVFPYFLLICLICVDYEFRLYNSLS